MTQEQERALAELAVWAQKNLETAAHLRGLVFKLQAAFGEETKR